MSSHIREPGSVEHVPVWPDGVRPAPSSATAGRRWSTTCCAAISSGAVLHVRLVSQTSPTSTTRSSNTRPTARTGRGQEITAKVRVAPWFEAMGKLGVQTPHRCSSRHRLRRRDGGDDRSSWSIGHAYTTDDGVYLTASSQVEATACLFNQAPRRHDQKGGGDRDVFGAENKRHPADFVLWKLGRRRAVVAVAVG